MLVNFLQNKGFCNVGDIVELEEDKAKNLIERGIVKAENAKTVKKETKQVTSKSTDK